MESIVKEFQSGKLVLGTRETLRLLKDGKIKLVYLSDTAPESVLNMLKEVEVKKLDMDAVVLGKSLGKSFPVTVCGVKK
ncbi:MAG: ribosomal L7Ae/L30e/S12e/Gadd45 family protein [Candidatus Aenigmarchaeota archaeon]|nr:ribosomal L7Ae/L30e/S12e/Gadd45 family protein [Candidatus Aenigmarchaeota archaeon]